MTSSEVTTYALHSLPKSDLRDVVLETIPGFLVTAGNRFISQVRFTCYQVLRLGGSLRVLRRGTRALWDGLHTPGCKVP